MADEYARNAQYAYAANSNLVLQADRSQLPRRDNEPSGEPETLWGKVDPRNMGDRAQRQRPDEAGVKRPPPVAQQEKKRRKVDAPVNITDADAFEGLMYRPRAPETRETYALILSYCHGYIGDSDQQLLRSAVDEVLAILKNEDMKDFDRKKEVEGLFGESLASESFSQLVALGKKITDYEVGAADAEQQGDDVDQDVGVAVVFDEDEESDADGQGYYDLSGSDAERDDAEDGDNAQASAQQPGKDGDENDAELSDDGEERIEMSRRRTDAQVLRPRDVDAFWLQRTLAQYYPDALVAQELANRLLDAMADAESIRDCENALVQLLNYDKFDLVKLLLRNRDVIVWCTRLARAGPEGSEREAVMQEMKQRGVAHILDTLAGSGRKAAAEAAAMDDMDVDRDVPRKAQPLSMAQKISDRAPKNVIDLEELKFAQGSHFMSNKKCVLPEGSYKTTKKTYEEITIPAPKAKPFDAGEALKPITDLPEWAQAGFKGMHFYKVLVDDGRCKIAQSRPKPRLSDCIWIGRKFAAVRSHRCRQNQRCHAYGSA
jgi:pre-mRNA-splicing helicase BRR2